MSEFRAAVITVSDRVAAGLYADRSGPAAVTKLSSFGFEIAGTQVTPDESREIVAALRNFCGQVQLIVTTGGTGCAPRDVTPEATVKVIERMTPGIAEKIRLAGSEFEPKSWLSRGVAGLCGSCLIVNLPGSPKAVEQSLDAIRELLPHAIRLAHGEKEHE